MPLVGMLCCCVLQEKWEEGYYITAMAGSMSSASLVVMSKGTPYTQQSYKVSPKPAMLCTVIRHGTASSPCPCSVHLRCYRGH